MELRRWSASAPSERSSALVDWSCSWIVRGFWRRQWYPSLGRHQPRYIAPYVKGDPGKPLKTPRATIFAVKR